MQRDHDIDVREGQSVAAGTVLAHLSSPDLEYRLQAAVAEEAALHWQVDQQPFDDALLKQGPALRKQWETVREAVAGLRAQVRQLTVRAPFTGRITDLNPDLLAGVWLKGGERLFDVVGNEGVKGEAFVEEADLPRVRDGAAADFVADLPELGTYQCRVSGIDHVNLTSLDLPYSASIFGGPIASRRDAGGAVLPLTSTFRVSFEHCTDVGGIFRELPGRVLLHGSGESVMASALRHMVAIFRKEMTT